MFQKKSLGQNFLRSKKALSEIISAGDLKPDDVVLEVGPGEGILTAELLKRAGKVIAVEKDNRLIPILSQKFSAEISSGKLLVAEGDILDFLPSAYSLAPGAYKIVANIPYYITGALLKKFLQSGCQPSRMVLLLQKEVAQRIVGTRAKPNKNLAAQSAKSGLKESILSISVKAYGEPKIIATVPAESFSPKPKVDSAILLIDNISKKFFAENNLDEQKFFALVKKGFANKRKMLAGNLELKNGKEKILADCGIDLKSRAENLTLKQWACLADKISKSLSAI